MTTTSNWIAWVVTCCVLCFSSSVFAEEAGDQPEEATPAAAPEEAATEETPTEESPTEEAEPEEVQEQLSEEEQTARARELFTEGVDLSDREQWAQASLRFEEALELRDAPSIRFNLAASYSQVERRVEAAEQIDIVLADPSTPEDLATRARALLTELEPLLGSITISASALAPSSQVLLDGRLVLAEQLSGSIRLDPGSHMVTATIDSREIAHEDVELEGGQSVDVVLRPIQPIEEAIVEPVDDRPPLYRDWRLWVGVGAGVVVLVIALAVGLSAGGGDVEDPIPGNMNPGILYWR